MEVLREYLVRCRCSVVARGGFAPAAFSGVAALTVNGGGCRGGWSWWLKLGLGFHV